MIQGLGNNDLYNTYNRIQLLPGQSNREALKPVKVEEQKSPREQSVQQNVSSAPQMDLKLDTIRPRVNADIEDISLSLATPSSFEMKGRDSDIDALDIQKAVSDMQKDSALQQYQFFVGDQTPIVNNEDGIVIPKF